MHPHFLSLAAVLQEMLHILCDGRQALTFHVVTWKYTACCSTAGCLPPDRCGRLRGTGLARGSAGVTGFVGPGGDKRQ